jgi:DNA helicase II / ATP-dependent DNA helicase PcrA
MAPACPSTTNGSLANICFEQSSGATPTNCAAPWTRNVGTSSPASFSSITPPKASSNNSRGSAADKSSSMAWDQGLTGTALQIAATGESPLRVMAGPGTGKSFAMKRRVARLLEEGVKPRRILAVTFTRNAAASIVEDLHNLNIAGCDEIRAGTLHSFCFSLLIKNEVLEFSGRVPRPVITFTKSGVLQFEGAAMLQDLINTHFGGGRDCTKRIRAFEAAWARLQFEQPGWPQDPVDHQFHASLIGWLRFHRAMLVGELVPEALRYLRNNPACDALVAYDHVLVDEYQDLNRAEQELLDILAANGQTAVIGDVDQSICRFRHGNPEGIEQYAATHPHTHDEDLDECRRCPTRVVAIADCLIRNNHLGVNQPRLKPRPSNPAGEVHIVQWPSLAAEAKGIAHCVSWLVNERDMSPEDIMILTPRRLLGYAIRDQIAAENVPVHSFYHEEALGSEAAQCVFATLSLAVNNQDRVALRWWLAHGSPSGRAGAYRRLRAHSEDSGQSPWEALTAIEERQLQLQNVGQLVTRFKQLKVSLAAIDGKPLPEVVNTLLPTGDDGTSVLREAANLAAPNAEDLSQLFEFLRVGVTQPEMREEGEFVRVMSLHKSKGLTSRVTIVTGCIQGLIPFERRDETPQEQQQILLELRRLFYVIITRSTEILVLSSALRLNRDLAFQIGCRVSKYGNPAATVVSQFLAEFGTTAQQRNRACYGKPRTSPRGASLKLLWELKLDQGFE